MAIADCALNKLKYAEQIQIIDIGQQILDKLSKSVGESHFGYLLLLLYNLILLKFHQYQLSITSWSV